MFKCNNACRPILFQYPPTKKGLDRPTLRELAPVPNFKAPDQGHLMIREILFVAVSGYE
jgi:hypothetical protein